ncbi:MAG: YkgJ family cysteine cluster protein [Pseudomonadota bacterium]
MSTPCQQCGACCAYFRVSFYWSEADPFLGGTVPGELTVPISPHFVAMAGTQGAPVRCTALEGTVGEAVACRIYARRASPCRDLEPWDAAGQPDEKCTRARAAHGLPPLAPRQGTPVDPDTPWPKIA